MYLRRVLPYLIIVVLLAIGCSGSSPGENPTAPGDGARDAAMGKSHIAIHGFYTIYIDKSAGTIKAVPKRAAQDVLNVLGFMEPPPHENLTIDFGTLEIDQAANQVNCDVILTHPLASNFFMGFEVRGVVFGPEVTNADGSTRWLNPEEFSSMPWGYQDGLLGAPDYYANYTNLYNDYKLFTDSYPNPMRGWDEDGEEITQYEYDPMNTFFEGGSTKTASYQLDFGDDPGDFLIFNYAIIANYAFPTGSAPFTAEDFPIEAHCPEPFLITVECYDNDAYSDMPYGAGGEIWMGVRVHDWTDPGANTVTIDSPDLGLSGLLPSSSQDGGNPVNWLYEFVLPISGMLEEGYYPITITVTDPMTYGESYFLDGMEPDHLLYDEPISVTIDTDIYINGVEIFIDSYQLGYLTYEDPYPDDFIPATIAVYVDWPGIEVLSVDLDTGPFELGMLSETEVKGDAGYQFFVHNIANLAPGDYPLDITVHFANLVDEEVQIDVEVVAAEDVPAPIYSHDISVGATNIGKVTVNTFDEATCGININKTFTPNGNAADPPCDEYRWIQVITTDAPLNGGPNTGYVDPHPSDDPPGNDLPFYWTDEEADDRDPPPPITGVNPGFSDAPRRPAAGIPPNPDPTWWHAELILVCVRWGGTDTLLHSEHYFFFKHADGTVDSGHYDGEDGGSEHARDVLGDEYPDYDFD